VFDGQYVVEGGQPASVFLQVLEDVQQRATASDDAGAASDTACEDGSCAVR
jgi:predicted DsbA family dithiol-disulfide isomerase